MSGCKNCGGGWSTDGSNYSFDLIRYSREEVQIIPVADGGIFKIVVDAGTFCCDTCLSAYLAKKPMEDK